MGHGTDSQGEQATRPLISSNRGACSNDTEESYRVNEEISVKPKAGPDLNENRGENLCWS